MTTRVGLLVQATYFVVTGMWGLLHIRSFMRVTGPKTDVWLVRTLSALICATALPMFMASLRREPPAEIAVLAASGAAALGAADVYYVARGRISKVYLVDAAAEFAFVAFWASQAPSFAAPDSEEPA